MRALKVFLSLFSQFLVFSLPCLAEQSFGIFFDGWTDLNANGLIDCSEPVTFRIALFQNDAPFGPETGRISVPFMTSTRWRFAPGSIRPDFILLDRCTWEIVSGNDPFDGAAVLNYSCDPHAGNPEDSTYAFQFRVTGEYLGGSIGPIIVDAENDRESPTAGSLHDVEANAGPLNPCVAPPDLRLTKTVASGDGSPGSLLVYDLAVSNFGNGPASSVVLEETVPQLTSFDAANSSAGWTCSPDGSAGSSCSLSLASLSAGASATRTFAVRVASSFPAPPPAAIDNTACAVATPDDERPDNNCGSITTPVGNPDLAIAKSVASGNGNPGSVLVYNLMVSNVGTRSAADVVLQETVPQLTTFLPGSSSPGWSCSPNGNAGSSCTLAVGSVGPATSSSFTFGVQVASTIPADPPVIDNRACVTTSSAGDPGANNCGTTSTPPEGSPDLKLTKSVVSGTGDPGATIVYRLLVEDLGNRDAAGVELNETVPALSSFLAAGSSPGWTCSPDGNAGSHCTLSLGIVGAGASATRTFAVKLATTFPANAPAIDNVACSSTTTPGDPQGNNCGTTSTPPAGHPDLCTEKTLLSGVGEPGATLVYSIQVDNIGDRDAVAVELTETVPALSTFLPGSSSPGWSCIPNDGAGAHCTLGLGDMAAGASASRTFAVRLAAVFPANAPTIDNIACSSTATSGDPQGNNCGSTSTPPGGTPDLRLAKSVASGSGDPGSTLVYRLVVTNGGNRGAAGVTIEETVPQLATFLPGSSSPGWTCTPDGNAGSACSLAIGTVAGGASATFTFGVELATSFPSDPPVIANTACARTTSGGDPQGDNCGSTSTPPGGHSDVRLVKTVASGSGEPGSVLVYQLAVSNAGTRDAEGVVIEETVPQLTTFLPASSSPGWSCAPDGNAGSSCSLSVGTLSAGSSTLFTFAVQVISSFPPGAPGIDNTACVTTASKGDPTENNCGTTSTPPGGHPDVRLVKTVASGNGEPGAVLVYQLAVSNAGTRDAEGVVIEETVPQLTTFIPLSSSPGWTCSPDGSAGSSCTLSLGTLAAGAALNLTFAVEVASSLPSDAPPIDNRACVSTTTGDDPEGNDCGSTSTPPAGSADLVLEKVLTSGTAVPNGVLVFTLTVKNQGNREATGVVLHETVPADSTFDAESSSPGWSCGAEGSAGAACTLPVGALAAEASESRLFAVRLRADLPAGTRVSNTACAEQAPGSSDPEENNCPTLIVDPPPLPDRTDVELAIGADQSVRQTGVPFLFTLTVRNASTVTAQGLRIAVALPSFGTQPTDLDPACRNPGGTVIFCSLDVLAGGGTVSLTWKQAAFQTGDYTVSAELSEANPEDVDSTPGNHSRTEDDFAEVSVSASAEPVVHDVPVLTDLGVCLMAALMVGLSIAAIRRGLPRFPESLRKGAERKA